MLQNIYLADSSIAENIAFGMPCQQIDLDRVKQAASQAQIASFMNPARRVTRALSANEAYASVVVKPTDWYRQGYVQKGAGLVLDEATSALDTTTEEAVMESINALSESLTVIMIAHRLTTIKSCDRVIRL